MRNLTLSLAAIVALAACGGPSSQDITTAKQARYHGDKSVLYRTAKAAVEETTKLAKEDEATLGFQTVGRWYTTEGILAPGSDEDYKHVPDQSIRITLVVRLLPEGDNWIVQVEPSLLRKQSGSPQPQPLDANDASVPGFVRGKGDSLQHTIWKALQAYEVKSPGGIAPAPTEPAPAATPEAPPADGSTDPAADPATP